MSEEASRPQAGWYPVGDGRSRYWDGEHWAPYVAPAPPSQPHPHPGAARVGRDLVVGRGPYTAVWAAATATPYAVRPYPGVPPVVPKSPALALLISFFVPGVGTMLNGEVGKGIFILVGYLMGFMLSIVLVGIPILIGFWVWGMADAYTGAQRWNAARGILS